MSELKLLNGKRKKAADETETQRPNRNGRNRRLAVKAARFIAIKLVKYAIGQTLGLPPGAMTMLELINRWLRRR